MRVPGISGASGNVAYLGVRVEASGVSRTNRELMTTQGSLERTAKKGTMMGGALKSAAKTGAVAIGVGLVYGLGQAISKGAEFERQMSTLGAVTEANGRQMKGFEKQALSLGESTQFTANDVARAQTELAKGGLAVDQIFGGGVKAALSLAAAGDLELAQAAETTVNAMQLFGIEGRAAGSVADTLATAANETTVDVIDFAMALRQGGSAAKIAGLDLNNTMAILEALAKAGTKNSDAGTSMKTALIQLLKPTKKQADLSRELGIEWTNQAGTMKGAVGVSRELTVATEGMTKAERLKTFATLAGTDGLRTLGALYDAGPAQLKRWEEANLRVGSAQDIARQKMNNLSGDAEQLTGALETTSIKLEHAFAPGLRSATQAATKGIQAINGLSLKDLEHDLGISNKDLREVGEAAQNVGQFWKRYFLPVIKDQVSGALQALRGFAQVVKGIVQVVSGLLTGDFGQAWKGVKNIFSGGIEFVLGNLRAATAPFKGAAVAIGDALGSAFSAAWGGIKSTFTNGANAVIDVVNSVIDVLNVIPGIPDIGKVGHVGGNGKQGKTGLHQQHRQKGGFVVPGVGSGDRTGFTGEVGAFVLNREATAHYGFQRGGHVPLALEPGERYFTPREVRAMGGVGAMEALNRSVPRFQEGGAVQGLGIGGIVESAANVVSPAAGAVVGKAADAVSSVVGKGAGYFVGKLPKPHIPEPFAGVGRYIVAKVADYIKNGFSEGKMGSSLGSMGLHGGIGSHPELQPGISAIVATILKRWPGLAITSTTGGGHADNSLHYSGRAADLAAGSEYMLKAAAWTKEHLSAQLTEGIHNPNLSIKYGHEVSPAYWGPETWADHLDHIHVGKQLGGLVLGLKDGGRITPVGKDLRRDFAEAVKRIWPRAASYYGKSAGSPMPHTLVMDLPSGAGETIHMRHGKTAIIDRNAALGLTYGHEPGAVGAPAGKGTLLHEWAHVFQAPGLKTWEAEGGAEDFKFWAGPAIFGDTGAFGSRTRRYSEYAANVLKNKGWGWVKHGQFKQLGGLIQALASGGGVVQNVGSILQNNGLDLVASAGILGNSWRESRWNTAAVGTGGGGLWGFTTSPISLADLKAYAASQGVDWTDTRAQTQFMLHHFPGSMRSAMNAMGSVEDTTTYFMKEWERPGIPALSERIEGAKKALAILGGDGGGELTAGQKKLAEGKQRKANNERHLQALTREVAEVHSTPAKQSKLWRLIKFWGRAGIFDKDEHAHILDAVQSAAAQTKPQAAVGILSNLADYAKGHGEITGQDPSNVRSMEKAIEQAQQRGQGQRQKAVERQKKHVEAAHDRVKSKLEKRSGFTDVGPTHRNLVAELANLRRGADVQEEYASQLVTLEPESLGDSYVDLERGAYQGELDRLLSWRNEVVRAQEIATAEIARFQQQLTGIEEMAPPANVKGSGKGTGLTSGQALGKTAYSKVAYKIPLLKEAIENATTMRDETWAGELEEIQGLNGPTGILASIGSDPVAGGIGGRIFETQNAIRELALEVGSVSDDSGSIALANQLALEANKRALVSDSLRVELEGWDQLRKGFAGFHALGGKIPAGMWGIAGEQGPEPVMGPATVMSNREGREVFGGGGTPTVNVYVYEGEKVDVEVDGEMVDAIVTHPKFDPAVQKAARSGRGTGRRTPGGARR